MDDAGPLGILAAGCAEREQLRCECPRGGAGARVHGHSGRLVDDDDVLVLVHDADGHRLGFEPGDRTGKLDLHHRSALETVTLRPHEAVDRHRAFRQQSLGKRACCDLASLGERSVEARPGLRLSDAEAKSRHGAIRACDVADRRARARRTGSRHRRR